MLTFDNKDRSGQKVENRIKFFALILKLKSLYKKRSIFLLVNVA